LGLKSHVEHPVGLVHHKVRHTAEVGLAHLKDVNQTTRGGNADLSSTLDVTDLRTLGDTTEKANVLDARGNTKVVGLLLNLHGELTSGG